MSSNIHPMGAMNYRGLAIVLSIVMAVLAISLFTTSRVLAETPPVVVPPESISVVAESLDGTPATDPAIAAFLQGATAVHEEELSFPVTAVNPLEIFPLGTTTVTFSAIDAASNPGTAQATVTVVPAAPTGLSAEGRDGEVFLDWDDSGPGLVYNVYRSETASGPYIAPIASGLAVSDYLDAGRTNGTTLFYVVTAVQAPDNESANSNEASTTPQDGTPPTITATLTPPPNAADWNNTDVTVTFECTDSGSGIAACSDSQILTTEGADQIVEGTATDLDGNTATATVSINLDKTAPAVTITSPAQDAVFPLSDNVAAVWVASDSLSGIDLESGTVATGSPIDTSAQGLNTFSVTATDLAGNSTMVSHTYSVVIPFALFELEKGSLELEQGAATDDFEVEGRLESADTSNGIDVPNEKVTVTFDGYTETIPAGSFVRNSDDDGFEFFGVAGGITQVQIKDDGSFRVRAGDLDLSSIVTSDSVRFSLRIGDDVGETDILFGVDPFSLEVREAKDLFGTVVSVTVLPDDFGVLVINTKDGIANVLTDVETQFRLPRNRDAGIVDLTAGDLVAVSLEEEDGVLVADKIFLVPGKTQFRHVPGEIVSLIVGEQITIELPGAAAPQLTFNITDETKINLRGRVEELSEGLFVVVSAVRDPSTGDISKDALEINVTRGRPPVVGPVEVDEDEGEGDIDDADVGDVGDIDDGDAGDIDDGDVGDIDDGDVGDIDDGDVGDRNAAEIQGVLGLDALGNWTVDGIVVAIDADTEIEGGLVLGQAVEVEGVLQEDGTILAQEIETEDEDDVVSSKTKLRGIFQGIDLDTGNWIISGNLVAVGPETDTDGLPFVGQRVKVEALLQEDGTLLAREIENKSGSTGRDDGSSEVKLDGIFLGVDADGKWIVNGASVLIDSLTRLKGAPTVGERIKVKALLLEDGSLLAVKIEGKGRSKSRSENKAEVRGNVDDILDDGTLVIDGVPISISILTDLDFDPEVGDSVEVEASIQPDGSLIAKEVEEASESDRGGVSEPSEAEIEGIIETVNPDGSLVVNGITVFIDQDAEIKGNLVEGAEVKLEGVLQEDGTLLAQELKTWGRQAAASGTDREIEGLVEHILRDSQGNILGIIVDGQTISAESLTQFEGLLEVGASVEVEGLEVNGVFVATNVEGEEDSDRSRSEEAREKGRAKAEEKAERKREKEEAKAEREQERAEERVEREQERAERQQGRDEQGDGEDSRTGLDGDEVFGTNSGSDSDGDRSGSDSDGDSSGSNSDGDSSGSDSDGDSSGSNSDGDSSGSNSDGDSSGSNSDGDSSGSDSDGDSSGSNSDGDSSGSNSDGDSSGSDSDVDSSGSDSDGDSSGSNSDGDSSGSNSDGDSSGSNSDGDSSGSNSGGDRSGSDSGGDSSGGDSSGSNSSDDD